MITSLSGKLLGRAGNEGKLVYGPRGMDVAESVRMSLLRDTNGFTLEGRSLDFFVDAVPEGYLVADLRYIVRACYRASRGSLAGPGQFKEVPLDQSSTNQVLCNNLLVTDLKGSGYDILTSGLQKVVYRFFSEHTKENPKDFALYVTQLRTVKFGNQRRLISARNKWQAQVLKMPDIPVTDSFYNTLGNLVGVYKNEPITRELIEKREAQSREFIAFLSQLLGFEENVLSSKGEHFPFLGTKLTKSGKGPLYHILIEPAVSRVDADTPIISGIRIESDLAGDCIAYAREKSVIINRLKRIEA